MASEPAVERRHPPDSLMRAVNPFARWLIGRGKAADALMLLHYTGRRSGRHYDTPVGYHEIDGQLMLLTNSRWRHNFAGGADIEVTYRGRRRAARAVLVDDVDYVADLYARQFQELGLRAAQRRLGVKVHVARQPTRTELADAIQRSGLSVIRIEFGAGDAPDGTAPAAEA